MKKKIISLISIAILLLLGVVIFLIEKEPKNHNNEENNSIEVINENIPEEPDEQNVDETIEENIKQEEQIKLDEEIQEAKEENKQIKKENVTYNQNNISLKKEENIQKEELAEEQTNLEPVQEITEQATESYTEFEIELAPKTECTDNNHGMAVGNTNRWFETKNEAIDFYKSEIKKWGEKWENFEIDNETYYSNCPAGYEIWTCPFCQKWTINFYYN